LLLLIAGMLQHVTVEMTVNHLQLQIINEQKDIIQNSLILKHKQKHS
jgi:hypothetical protein